MGEPSAQVQASAPVDRPPWWTEPLPPVEGNPPPVRPPVPPGLWGGPPLPPPMGYPASSTAVAPGLATLAAGASRGVGRGAFASGLVAAVVVSATASGLIAWAAGAAAGRHEGRTTTQASVLDPAARLPVSEPAVRRTAPAAGSVSAIAAAIVPSVVTVQVRRGDLRGTGAGVIVRSDGYILTNNHVVAPQGQTGTLTVDLSPAQSGIPATIVGRSPVDDLAVIKVDLGSLRAARLGRSATLQVGDEVVAVGAPLGLSGTVTSGIVSALARNIDVPGEGSATTVLGNAIQTDAAINPGNSGGALVDVTGAVVGINSAIASTSDSNTESGSIGVGFAIPIDYARSVAEEIIRTGKATHPYLGIVPDTIDADHPIPGGPASGAFVREVRRGTPAAGAALEAGDVIVALDGTRIDSADDLIVATRSHRIGEAVVITYVRGGEQRSARVILVQNPQG